jgi:diguanylate cyclase (GGDEF)-like protein
MDRERLLDMEQRLRPVRRAALAVLAVALLVCGPWIGWWTLVPLLFAALLFTVADNKLPNAKRPEYIMFAAWAGSELTIAAAVALTEGPRMYALAWLAIPVVTLSARFSIRGVVAGVITALTLMAAVAFGADVQAVLDDPPVLLAPAALVVTVAMLSTALMRSDVEHRGEAVIDQLTGMLNRKALARRVGELAQQSKVTGQPIGIVLADLDHFKQINDTHGHAAGDAVLKDVAYLMRKRLRAFDTLYRIGGEEFLVLFPGGDLKQSSAVAEELRDAIAGDTLGGGIHVTMSFGVSASLPDHIFDYDAVFAEADARLYEAKRSGRNCVRDGTAPLKSVSAA